MAVTAETLDTSVKRLESQAGLRASAYKLRVFLLATLGYTYIFFVLGALLLLVGLLVWLAATTVPVASSGSYSSRYVVSYSSFCVPSGSAYHHLKVLL
jgi:hypothetical protein